MAYADWIIQPSEPGGRPWAGVKGFLICDGPFMVTRLLTYFHQPTTDFIKNSV